jgi:hypothetical protein
VTIAIMAQYGSDDACGALFLFLLILLGLAAIPAVIASNKGYSGAGFYFFGLFFFLPALIVALLIQTKPGSRDAPVRPRSPAGPATLVSGLPSGPSRESASVLPPAPASSPGSAPVASRECPFCKEAMRRDASVCPHCRRESVPWLYREGKWWTVDDEGVEVWLEESTGIWRAADYEAEASSYHVILLSAGSDPTRVMDVLKKKLSYQTSGAKGAVQNPGRWLPAIVTRWKRRSCFGRSRLQEVEPRSARVARASG